MDSKLHYILIIPSILKLTCEQIPQPIQRSSDRTAILSAGVTAMHNLPKKEMGIELILLCRYLSKRDSK